jgi:peptidoglycan/xylan/chitin deacetylase (PgdA/CDA1 family)
MPIRQIAYSPLIDRPPLRWPGDARVAVWVQINLECWEVDGPGMGLPPNRPVPQVPDVKNLSWRDYGARVGVWRLMELLDRHGIRASAPTNAQVCAQNPEIIREGLARGWEFMGHGLNNSRTLNGLEQAEERAVIQTCLETLASATGQRIRGWLGPGLAETFDTLDVLAEAGVEYVTDWCNDDQPYPVDVPGGKLIMVPFSLGLADASASLGLGFSPEQFYRVICDQFDVLYEEGSRTGRMLCLDLHPFISGEAFRAKWIDAALKHILGHDQVWVTTAGEIADWYDEHYYAEAVERLRRSENE